MTCAVCGTECKLEKQEFFTGVCPESLRPGEVFKPIRWSFMAPTYFIANTSLTAVEVPFCSLPCSAAYPRVA